MSSEFTEFITGLPDELALECLTRLHYTVHRIAAGVCRGWRDLVVSRDFYSHRNRTGRTCKAACLVQALPFQSETHGRKPVGPPMYGLCLFDPVAGTWDRIEAIPKYPDGLPLFCQVASSEGKLLVMGGWNPASWDPVRDVFVYEFTTRRWTQRTDMPSTRSFFAVGALDGRVFVAGGHDENKNALNTAWVYDIRTDEWAELSPMSEERDECQGVIIGSEFWVVSGYDTESQGGFKSSVEAFDPQTGQWRRVDGAWRASQCPRSCVGVRKDGKLVSWAESDPAVRVATSAVELGSQTLVTGSGYQGGPPGMYIGEGQTGKLAKMEVPEPEEYSGYVQSGCCVEI